MKAQSGFLFFAQCRSVILVRTGLISAGPWLTAVLPPLSSVLRGAVSAVLFLRCSARSRPKALLNQESCSSLMSLFLRRWRAHSRAQVDAGASSILRALRCERPSEGGGGPVHDAICGDE